MTNPNRFTGFIGAKNADGVFQKIINLIPPHGVFIELFAGTAAITRRIRPAAETVLVDVVDRPELRELARTRQGTRFLCTDGIAFAKGYRYKGNEVAYIDPPYFLPARGGRRYYENELTEADHGRLLRVARSINAQVIISGYSSPLYNRELCDWHRSEFEVMTRGGTKATEVLWCNFPPPQTLHDYSHVGANTRERQDFRRKIKRAVADLASLPPVKRHALFAALAASVGNLGAAALLPGRQPAAARGETAAAGSRYTGAEIAPGRVTTPAHRGVSAAPAGAALGDTPANRF